MNKAHYQLIVIGGGPAGLAGAIQAAKEGLTKILILERDEHLGGILRQCIHNGFGLHIFKEELSGPEYAAKWVEQLQDLPIDVMLNTTVIQISADKEMIVVNQEGIHQLTSDNILLAMGCRERTRGAIMTPGFRPAGVYTAGLAQKLVNINGYLPGKEVVIVGSGDIGLIMARRMTLEKAHVQLVTEIMPYSSGLARNIAQCVNDFDIPLKFKTTITKIHGKDRVTGVTIATVDKDLKPLKDTESFVSCDTVLFSVGLIPENELSTQIGIDLDPITGGPIVSEELETSLPGFYACGNVLHVHDLVDNVSQEAIKAAKAIASKSIKRENAINVEHDQKIRYVIPQKVNSLDHDELTFSLRVTDVYRNVQIMIISDNVTIYQQRKPILTPGEMVKLTIKKDVINKIKDDLYLKLEVKEDA